MPGYNHYPHCNCDWCRGGGGWGTGGGRTSYCSLPAAGTRTTWDEDTCCYPTTCPICGAFVYFVRHNGGSVWFDSLGKPWPKHGCFFDDGYGVRLRTRLGQQMEGITEPFFGVVTETVVTKPGESGRIVIQCSDNRIIDQEFTTKADLTRYPGTLVIIEGAPGSYGLHPVAGDRKVIEVWKCPQLGYVLIYDPSSQQGVKETEESRFWVWDKKRWTTLLDYYIQPHFVSLNSQDATRIAYDYLQALPAPPAIATSSFPWLTLSGRTHRNNASSIPAVIFPGTNYERRFILPSVLTPGRVAEWIREVEAVRRQRKI